MQANKPYGGVLVKAVRILDYLSQTQSPQSMTNIAVECQLTMSTTNKILDTLEILGFVRKNMGDKTYALGPRLLQLANAAFIQFDLLRESYPILYRLFQKVDATVNMGMLQEKSVLYVNKFTPAVNRHVTQSRIGFREDLYCSAMGKALLAAQEDDYIEEYLENSHLEKRTDYTIIQPEIIRRQIAIARRNGYATDNREAEDNIFCIGTTMGDSQALSRYAFSISIPYDQLTSKRFEALIGELQKAKAVIEYQLTEI